MARVSKFTDEQKLQIALDLLGGKLSHAEICRKYDISSTYAYKLKDRAVDIHRTVLELVGVGRADVVLAADLGVRELAAQQVQRDLQLLFIGELRYSCHKHRLLGSRLPAAPVALRAPSAPGNPF